MRSARKKTSSNFFMTEYLLDTNVLIYLLKKNPLVIKKLRSLKVSLYSISVISYFEFLAGVSDDQVDRAERYLKKFNVISFNEEIAKEAVHFSHSIKKKLKFKDLVIAATAKKRSKRLITADRDFRLLKGVEVDYMTM